MRLCLCFSPHLLLETVQSLPLPLLQPAMLLPLFCAQIHWAATGRISTVNIMNAFGKWLVVFAFCISSHSFMFMCGCGFCFACGLPAIAQLCQQQQQAMPKTAFSFLRIDWPSRSHTTHASFYFLLHFFKQSQPLPLSLPMVLLSSTLPGTCCCYAADAAETSAGQLFFALRLCCAFAFAILIK